MSEVEKFRALHPRETILSKNEAVVSNTVRPTKQSIIALTNWLLEDDPDQYSDDDVLQAT